MTMTTEKLAELKQRISLYACALVAGKPDEAERVFAQIESLIALAERALQPEDGQADLLPCPFCGSAADDFNPDGEHEGYRINCSGDSQFMRADSSSCPIHTFGYSTYEDAKTAWNRRASQLALPAGPVPTDEQIMNIVRSGAWSPTNEQAIAHARKVLQSSPAGPVPATMGEALELMGRRQAEVSAAIKRMEAGEQNGLGLMDLYRLSVALSYAQNVLPSPAVAQPVPAGYVNLDKLERGMAYATKWQTSDKQTPFYTIPTAVAQPVADEDVIKLIEDYRISVSPEYEGGFHANVYADNEVSVASGEGQTVREAVMHAVAEYGLKGDDDE